MNNFDDNKNENFVHPDDDSDQTWNSGNFNQTHESEPPPPPPPPPLQFFPPPEPERRVNAWGATSPLPKTPFEQPTENTSTRQIFDYQKNKASETSKTNENKSSPSYTTIIFAFMAAIVGVMVGVSMNEQAQVSNTPNSVGRPSYNFNMNEEDYTIAEVLTLTAPSVVAVSSPAFGSSFAGAGSGVIISAEGAVLTNAHVIGDNTTVFLTLFDGTQLEANLVGSYPEEDIAVLQIVNVPSNLPVAELGNSIEMQVGDEVVAIGNALGLGTSPTVTSGIISGKDRTLEAEGGLVLKNLLQTDSAINPGNSGGPLVNSKGKVIGINTAIIPNANSVGFAIPIDSIKPLVESILNGQGTVRSDQAFLGVVGRPSSGLPDDVRNEFGVSDSSGVFILETVPGSSAYVAGLRAGDVILSINGQPVDSPDALASIVRSSTVGEKVDVTFERQGDPQKLTVELQRRGPATP